MRKPQYSHHSHTLVFPLETKEMNFCYGGNLLLPEGCIAHCGCLRLRQHQEALLHIVQGFCIHFILHLLGIEHAVIWNRREWNSTMWCSGRAWFEMAGLEEAGWPSVPAPCYCRSHLIPSQCLNLTPRSMTLIYPKLWITHRGGDINFCHSKDVFTPISHH